MVYMHGSVLGRPVYARTAKKRNAKALAIAKAKPAHKSAQAIMARAWAYGRRVEQAVRISGGTLVASSLLKMGKTILRRLTRTTEVFINGEYYVQYVITRSALSRAHRVVMHTAVQDRPQFFHVVPRKILYEFLGDADKRTLYLRFDGEEYVCDALDIIDYQDAW